MLLFDITKTKSNIFYLKNFNCACLHLMKYVIQLNPDIMPLIFDIQKKLVIFLDCY